MLIGEASYRVSRPKSSSTQEESARVEVSYYQWNAKEISMIRPCECGVACFSCIYVQFVELMNVALLKIFHRNSNIAAMIRVWGNRLLPLNRDCKV